MEAYIIVTYVDDFFGKLARKLKIAQWTHAAIRYKENLSWRVLESTFWGIKERGWVEFIDEKDEFVILEVIGLTPELMQKAIDYGWGNVGKPYAFHWLIKIIIRLLKERFFLPQMFHWHVCSSFVYNCIQYAGIDLIPDSKNVLVTPDELYNSELTKIVETPLTSR